MVALMPSYFAKGWLSLNFTTSYRNMGEDVKGQSSWHTACKMSIAPLLGKKRWGKRFLK